MFSHTRLMQRQADTGAVGRDVGEPRVAADPRVAMRDRRAADRDVACERPPEPGDALDQLVLAVALHAGEADDLARPHVEREVVDRASRRGRRAPSGRRP